MSYLDVLKLVDDDKVSRRQEKKQLGVLLGRLMKKPKISTEINSVYTSMIKNAEREQQNDLGVYVPYPDMGEALIKWAEIKESHAKRAQEKQRDIQEHRASINRFKQITERNKRAREAEKKRHSRLKAHLKKLVDSVPPPPTEPPTKAKRVPSRRRPGRPRTGKTPVARFKESTKRSRTQTPGLSRTVIKTRRKILSSKKTRKTTKPRKKSKLARVYTRKGGRKGGRRRRSRK
tara:strand:+ start:317 stop:1015 length:699 start_codon:yes stop_codon:yes gene_type:complete